MVYKNIVSYSLPFISVKQLYLLLFDHSALCTLHSALCTLHSTLCTLHSALYTLHSTLCTLHCTLYNRPLTTCFITPLLLNIDSSQFTSDMYIPVWDTISPTIANTGSTPSFFLFFYYLNDSFFNFFSAWNVFLFHKLGF